jgi:hypothetical protein
VAHILRGVDIIGLVFRGVGGCDQLAEHRISLRFLCCDPVSIVALNLLQPLSHVRQAKNALSRVFREPIVSVDDRPEVRPNKVPDCKDEKHRRD